MINLDFILIPVDYLRTRKFRDFTFEILIPIIISFGVYLAIYYKSGYISFDGYIEKIISLEGILVGFSITTITFLTTASNEGVQILKTADSGFKISGNAITVFNVVIINFSFSLLVEIFILIVNLIFPFFIDYIEPSYRTKVILMSANLFFVIHNLLLNVSNMTDVYFTIFNKRS